MKSCEDVMENENLKNNISAILIRNLHYNIELKIHILPLKTR